MARILIAEDEEKIARFVTLELEHEGYQVEHAADGRTAVDLALERDYDLILLDVCLLYTSQYSGVIQQSDYDPQKVGKGAMSYTAVENSMKLAVLMRCV